jgi:hypothetical protein
MGAVERSVRRHFEREIRTVRVPAPAIPAPAERRIHPLIGDAIVRTAAVLVAAGSLVVLARDLPRETPLRKAIATAASERSWERYLPGAASIRDLIDSSFDRRKTQ